MRQKNFFFVVLFLITAISSCKDQNNEDIKKQIESSVEINYWDGPNVIESDNGILVSIENQSQYCIEFPVDFNLRIFTKNNDTWVEISDTAESFGGKLGVVTLYPKGDFRNSTIVGSSPDLSDITLPADFYASIEGNICGNEDVIVEKDIPFRIFPNP